MATHRITVSKSNINHWHYSLNGGTDVMVMSGDTADITAAEGSNTIVVKGVDDEHTVLATDSTTFDYSTGPQQPPNQTAVTCWQADVINRGAGFTDVNAIKNLFTGYGWRDFYEISSYGNDFHGYTANLTIGGGNSGLASGTIATLDANGGIARFCMSNWGMDVDEDDDGPQTHFFYIFLEPQGGTTDMDKLWLKIDYGPGQTLWNKGWRRGNANAFQTTGPDLTKIHAIIRYRVRFSFVGD